MTYDQTQAAKRAIEAIRRIADDLKRWGIEPARPPDERVAARLRRIADDIESAQPKEIAESPELQHAEAVAYAHNRTLERLIAHFQEGLKKSDCAALGGIFQPYVAEIMAAFPPPDYAAEFIPPSAVAIRRVDWSTPESNQPSEP